MNSFLLIFISLIFRFLSYSRKFINKKFIQVLPDLIVKLLKKKQKMIDIK